MAGVFLRRRLGWLWLRIWSSAHPRASAPRGKPLQNPILGKGNGGNGGQGQKNEVPQKRWGPRGRVNLHKLWV